MSETVDKGFLKALGSRLLAELNDLKRTPEALAHDIGWAAADVEAVIEGTAGYDTAVGLLRAVAEAYPVSLADLWLDPDDTDGGARIMRAGESETSTRVFQRLDRGGTKTDYYEYRDTAMSRTAPFKPEWIRELRVVADADPDNPDVAYNNGHLLHQTTFFIGPVNFYWELDGVRHCAELDTGDSNYITPFVPHSFTSRDPNRSALIIAVTYAGEVRRAMTEFGRIGAHAANEMAGDLRDAASVFAAKLKRHLATESLSRVQLVERLTAAGLTGPRADAIAAGDIPDGEELSRLAGVLNIRIADLTTLPLAAAQEVVVRRAAECPERAYPDDNCPAYRLTELARTPHQPGLKGFQVHGAGRRRR